MVVEMRSKKKGRGWKVGEGEKSIQVFDVETAVVVTDN